MIYLDTGCLVKLYYPEPDSSKIVAHVQTKLVCFTQVHELELVNALRLKIFFGDATSAQAMAAQSMVASDLNAGVLRLIHPNWREVFREATKLAELQTGKLGCRSLDILHCAIAKTIAADEFLTTDARQKKLAAAIGLKLLAL